jgi:cell division protein FtsI/penicillin-binding protein 2
MAEAARRFGLRVFETGPASLNAGPSRNLWNTENALLSDVFAPLSSTFVASRRISKYDLALESIGQGFVQLTPFQMAMIAGAVANTQGMVMRPKLELDRAPAALSQAMSPQASARVREFMASVVKGGTARGPFAAIIQGKTTAGGKTGTAQREVPVIDQRTGKPAVYRDGRGRERVRREHRIDSWFIGFAPVENPQIAFAVVVEGGGYGSRTSAPIAANLLVKAQALGLLNPPPAQVASRQK